MAEAVNKAVVLQQIKERIRAGAMQMTTENVKEGLKTSIADLLVMLTEGKEPEYKNIIINMLKVNVAALKKLGEPTNEIDFALRYLKKQ